MHDVFQHHWRRLICAKQGDFRHQLKEIGAQQVWWLQTPSKEANEIVGD